jgi:hypothetical protein
MRIEEFAMPGWNEASVDELLADPIVRDLMAADGVDPAELRALLHEVQRTIDCYAAGRGGPTSLAGFAQLYSATPIARANRGRSDVRKTRIALADHSRVSNRPRASMSDDEARRTARS